ncbi:hypothetical protein NMG60_11007031 [Bertholletia excelsa]
MDRRSWLWRRKSSEKSPGETESSGSASSQFERFSDDQACPNHQSPEVTSKAAPSDEELNDSVKSLTEKLSAALLNIRAKEDLVKQNAKVAEEAVSGWEKAESEVLTLKHHLEVSTQKNLVLEDRICHLDGALKECVRQLRQARVEQEQKIHEAVAKKAHEWEFARSELENKLAQLQSQLEATKIKPLASVDADLRPKLQAVEKENSALKLELLSRAEELETRIIERDLSTQAAETASKQHLESIRKVAKLEAECCRLRAVAHKASPANDHRSLAASSVCVESFTDCQSDIGDRILMVDNDGQRINGLEPNECEASHSESWSSVSIAGLHQFRNDKTLGRNGIVPTVEINLMDDFLEMERLAALPETEIGNCCPKSEPFSDQPLGEGPLKAELEAIFKRTAELEEKLEKAEAKKVEMEMAFIECQAQLMTSKDELVKTEIKLMELQNQLCLANETRNVYDATLEAANSKRESAESQLSITEAETKNLLVRVACLEEEVQKERALSAEAAIKCQKMVDEILRMKREAEILHSASSKDDMKAKQDLATAASKLAECQKTIASLGRRLKCLADMEDLLSESGSEWDKPLQVLKEGSNLRDGTKLLKLNSANFFLPAKGSEVPGNVGHAAVPVSEENDKGLVAIRKQGSDHLQESKWLCKVVSGVTARDK